MNPGLCVRVCVCCVGVCLSPNAHQSRPGPRFPKEPFSVRAGRADLNPDHHKHTPLFYNKSRLPKTAPKVSMCWGKKMDSTGMEHGGQAGGEKLAKSALAPPVGGVQVCAKAGNLFGSIRRSEAEAQRLGCSLLRVLQGALITVIAPPCSLRFFDISALAQSLILAFGQIFPGPRRACAGRDERVLWYSC